MRGQQHGEYSPFNSSGHGVPCTTMQVSIPAGCLTLQFDSDTIYLEIASDPTSEGTSPTKLASPSLQMPIASPGVTCASDCKSELPMTPSLGLINLQGQVEEPRKQVYSLDYWFITKYIKGY